MTYSVQPAIRVPCPASNGAVDKSGPEEAENERRNDSSTLKCTSNNDLNSASTEEELVETEDNLGNVGVADRRRRHDILHAKVGEVTNEGPGSAAVSQRVSPKHPLECGDGANQDGLEDQGEGGLSTGEAAVEQTKAGDDQVDNEAAEGDVCVVELDAFVLGVDVHLERIASIGLGLIVDGLWREIREQNSKT